jgi:hypothetical protein
MNTTEHSIRHAIPIAGFPHRGDLTALVVNDVREELRHSRTGNVLRDELRAWRSGVARQPRKFLNGSVSQMRPSRYSRTQPM